MTAKNKQGRRPATTGSNVFQEIERLIAKERLKEAVHEAKLCFKQQSSPESHRLLERAYLLRADQLRRNAMPAAASEVAQHLLDFGITDEPLVEDAVRLLVALGMSKPASELRGRIQSPEAQERLARQQADVAVVHPEQGSEVSQDVKDGAALIRSAFVTLQSGDEAGAVALLREVPRSSPFSDWKLFVRGLAALSRNAADETKANWDRLDPDRAAARIARFLRGAGDTSGSKSAGNLEPLEKQVFGEPVLDLLEQLRGFIVQGRWHDALRRVVTLRPRLQRIDAGLNERLTRVLYDPLVKAILDLEYRDAMALARQFHQAAQPLAIDPRWNRFWALLWESPRGSLDDVDRSWRAYLADLETLPAFGPEERQLARALVCKHLGKRFQDEAESLSGGVPFAPPRLVQGLRELRTHAFSLFEESLRLAPDHRPTYRALFEAYSNSDRKEDAAAVARRVLERFPDDLEMLQFLIDYHFRRNEPEPALEYVQRARALKPLDDDLAQDEWAVRLARARSLALKGRFEEGREEFQAAERVRPESSKDVHYQARRAVFELKAGASEQAEAIIAEVQEQLSEATPLWLTLAIESTRYKLPKADRERFEARWLNAVGRKVRGETAGALAKIMTGFIKVFDYPGKDAHLRLVADYLRRTTRVKYRQAELESVCRFLNRLPAEQVLYEKMVARGLKLFPKAPQFMVMKAEILLANQPPGGRQVLEARRWVEKALVIAEQSKDPEETALLPVIRDSLSVLRDSTSGPLGFPFFGPGPQGAAPRGQPPGFAEFMEVLAGMMEMDEDDEWDEEEEGWIPPPEAFAHRAPKPKSRAKAKKKKRKRP